MREVPDRPVIEALRKLTFAIRRKAAVQIASNIDNATVKVILNRERVERRQIDTGLLEALR